MRLAKLIVGFRPVADIIAMMHQCDMKFRLSLNVWLMPLALAACGPTTSVRNDTSEDVYVDFIDSKLFRPPSPQRLVSGNVYSGPWSPKEAGILYIGSDPNKLQQFAVANLCDTKKQSCEMRVSEFDALLGHGEK